MAKKNEFEKLTLKNAPPKDTAIESTNQDTDKLNLNEQKKIRFGQDTKHRKQLVCWMMWVVSIWLGIVMFILMFNKLLKFNIDNEILITLLATTTINVLGLANIILKGLFGRGASSRKK